MKLMLFMLSLSFLCNNNFPPKDILDVTNLIHAFSEGADQRDVNKLSALLHPNFRAIVNQAFGSSEIQFMDKTTYLDLLEKEVIGGDKRKVTILSIDMEENNAVVKVKLAGKKLVFTTFIQVVKDSNQEWKVMSDLPVIQKVE